MSKSQEERALAARERAIVVDAHSDIPVDVSRRRVWYGEHRVIERIHLPKMTKGGVDVIVSIVGGDSKMQVMGRTDRAVDATVTNISLVDDDVMESRASVAKVTTVSQIRKAKKEGRFAVMYGLEGMKPVGDSLNNLRTLYNLGVRSALLTWNDRNLVADGVFERTIAGLSNFGVEVVREMNKLRMIIDVSHINKNGFFEALELSNGPVVASHSNAYALCAHKRNLTDEQIKALAEKNGVMGVCFFPAFVSQEKASLEGVLDHIDHVSRLVGTKHIGIGADYIDYDADFVLAEMNAAGRGFGSGFRLIKGLEDSSTFYNITRGLVSRGYSDQEIDGILGENLLRLYESVLGS